MMDWKSSFSEDGGKTLSLGRIAFWIALGYSTWFWFHPFGAAYPQALLEFLYATLAYNLGSKGLNTYKNVKTSVAGIMSGVSNAICPPQQQPPAVSPPVAQPQDDITDEDLANTRKP